MYIFTFTGKKFYPFRPDPSMVDIIDIAHALSQICRFNGHTKEFYSVAQHSVLVSSLCDHNFALQGLLHDAHEAYIGDVASPLKQSPVYADYVLLEKSIQAVVYAKFGLDLPDPPSIKWADMAALSREAQIFMPHRLYDVEEAWGVAPGALVSLNPREAKMEFLARFQDLTRE